MGTGHIYHVPLRKLPPSPEGRNDYREPRPKRAEAPEGRDVQGSFLEIDQTDNVARPGFWESVGQF